MTPLHREPNAPPAGPHRTATAATLAALSAALVAACGGGDDSPSPPPPPPPPAAALTLTGTAASGHAIGGATVDATCATGTGTTTTTATGNYTMTINGGALPCAVRSTATDNTRLHGLAVGSGDNAVANLTPFTELVVARHAGTTPTDYFDAFGAARAQALSAGATQQAVTGVARTLAEGGLDIAPLGNVLTEAVVPPIGTAAGNAHDQALDALHDVLAERALSLAALTQAVARQSPAAPASGPTPAAALSAGLLLAEPAAQCDALRSARYRLTMSEDRGQSVATDVVTVDAAGLELSAAGGQTWQLTPTATCRYSVSGGGEAVVTAAGVVVARLAGTIAGALRGAVLFPEQTHDVADLAGSWNTVALDRTGGNPAHHLTAASFDVGSNGHVDALTLCDDARTCAPLAGNSLPQITLAANAGGGFDHTNATENRTDRFFAYRAGGGETLIARVATGGAVAFGTRKAPVAQPAVGSSQDLWTVFVTAQAASPSALLLSRNTVASTDAAAGTWVRDAVQNFGTGSTRPETMAANNPLEGFVRRMAATGVQHSDGTTSNVTEFVSLPLRGMEVTAGAFLSNGQLGLSAAAAP
ncbi:MAG: hypothetical protein IT181_12620 [Acidobacteria bacterium]|nr:hypothetical protein [Acidobacteriota bacterium]